MLTLGAILFVLIGIPALFVLAVIIYLWVFMIRVIIGAIAIVGMIIFTIYIMHNIILNHQQYNLPVQSHNLSSNWQGYQKRRNLSYQELWQCRKTQGSTVAAWMDCNDRASAILNRGQK